MSDEPTSDTTDITPQVSDSPASEPVKDEDAPQIGVEVPTSADEQADSPLSTDAIPDVDPTADDEEITSTEGQVESEAAQPAEQSKKKWYVVKVASGREESIKAAIERMVKIEGQEHVFGQIVIPVERITEVKKVTETKAGQKVTKEKRVVKEKKKFPGYLMAEVEWTPDLQALFRDTSGVGDFVGSTGPGKEPAPMSERDVQSMLYGMLDTDDPKRKDLKPAKEKIKLDFDVGDKVRIREGAFATFEGEVTTIQLPKEAGETPKVIVKVMVLGRHTDIELEYWQVDKA